MSKIQGWQIFSLRTLDIVFYYFLESVQMFFYIICVFYLCLFQRSSLPVVLWNFTAMFLDVHLVLAMLLEVLHKYEDFIALRCLCSSSHLEKEMATHSSILAWKIPWTEEPGRLQPMGLQRVGHDWAHTHSIHSMCSVNKCLLKRINVNKSKIISCPEFIWPRW